MHYLQHEKEPLSPLLFIVHIAYNIDVVGILFKYVIIKVETCLSCNACSFRLQGIL